MTAAKRLADFRKGEEIPLILRHKPELPKWAPNEWVMAFDQSLASTGWAILSTDVNSCPYVERTGMVKTDPTNKGGFEDTFERVALMETAFYELMEEYVPTRVVHEMPAIYGKRTDASLVAALTLRSVCRLTGIPVSGIYAQHIKKVVTGVGNATKAQVKSHVKSHVPNVVNCKPANEHTYDAVAIALTYLKDLP